MKRVWRRSCGHATCSSTSGWTWQTSSLGGFHPRRRKLLRDESDVDLDIVVNNDHLLEEMDQSDSASEADSSVSSDSDVLPPVTAPSKRRR